jgi:hypothetical protein
VETVPVPVNPPLPSPSLIAMLSAPTLAIARSSNPSALNLPTAIELGRLPPATGAAGVN